MRIALRDIFFYGMCQRGICPSRHHKVPGGVHHHADTIMQESSYLFAQAGERPRLYERLLYSAGHPTSGVRHNDEQEQYNDIVTCVKENYSAESSVLLYITPKNNRPLHHINTMACCD